MKILLDKIKRIKAIVFDIDGVLTDGTISINSEGKELKRIYLPDVDYINILQRSGYMIAAITGEDTPIVDFFKNKFSWDYFIAGCKNKGAELQKVANKFGFALDSVCYIGDGYYDISALKNAGLAVCPSNAIAEAKKQADIILDSCGGGGCVSELYGIFTNVCVETKEQKAVIDIFDDLFIRYNKLSSIRENIYGAYCLLRNTFESGNKVLICGNGGSAADSQHIVGELMKRFVKKRPIPKEIANKLLEIDELKGINMVSKLESGLPAIALTTHEALTTAYNNDVDSKLSYAQQLLGYGKTGDCLIAISTSGNSENVLNAAVLAKAMGISVLGLTGSTGGELAELAEVSIIVPVEETYKIQEYHLPIYHCLCMMLEEYFF